MACDSKGCHCKCATFAEISGVPADQRERIRLLVAASFVSTRAIYLDDHAGRYYRLLYDMAIRAVLDTP